VFFMIHAWQKWQFRPFVVPPDSEAAGKLLISQRHRLGLG
jgi:hypothetical protein